MHKATAGSNAPFLTKFLNVGITSASFTHSQSLIRKCQTFANWLEYLVILLTGYTLV